VFKFSVVTGIKKKLIWQGQHLTYLFELYHKKENFSINKKFIHKYHRP
jgi:hypothetical protein